jgi:hypothetical protein
LRPHRRGFQGPRPSGEEERFVGEEVIRPLCIDTEFAFGWKFHVNHKLFPAGRLVCQAECPRYNSGTRVSYLFTEPVPRDVARLRWLHREHIKGGLTI